MKEQQLDLFKSAAIISCSSCGKAIIVTPRRRGPVGNEESMTNTDLSRRCWQCALDRQVAESRVSLTPPTPRS